MSTVAIKSTLLNESFDVVLETNETLPPRTLQNLNPTPVVETTLTLKFDGFQLTSDKNDAVARQAEKEALVDALFNEAIKMFNEATDQQIETVVGSIFRNSSPRYVATVNASYDGLIQLVNNEAKVS
jgi:hypothetical protein